MGGYIEKLIAVNDWRYQIAGLQGIAVTVDFLANPTQELAQILEFLKVCLVHPHFKVVSAACHVLERICQMSDRMSENCLNLILELIFPITAHVFPKLRNQALACLSSFFLRAPLFFKEYYFPKILRLFKEVLGSRTIPEIEHISVCLGNILEGNQAIVLSNFQNIRDLLALHLDIYQQQNLGNLFLKLNIFRIFTIMISQISEVDQELVFDDVMNRIRKIIEQASVIELKRHISLSISILCQMADANPLRFQNFFPFVLEIIFKYLSEIVYPEWLALPEGKSKIIFSPNSPLNLAQLFSKLFVKINPQRASKNLRKLIWSNLYLIEIQSGDSLTTKTQLFVSLKKLCDLLKRFNSPVLTSDFHFAFYGEILHSGQKSIVKQIFVFVNKFLLLNSDFSILPVCGQIFTSVIRSAGNLFSEEEYPAIYNQVTIYQERYAHILSKEATPLDFELGPGQDQPEESNEELFLEFETELSQAVGQILTHYKETQMVIDIITRFTLTSISENSSLQRNYMKIQLISDLLKRVAPLIPQDSLLAFDAIIWNGLHSPNLQMIQLSAEALGSLAKAEGTYFLNQRLEPFWQLLNRSRFLTSTFIIAKDEKSVKDHMLISMGQMLILLKAQSEKESRPTSQIIMNDGHTSRTRQVLLSKFISWVRDLPITSQSDLIKLNFQNFLALTEFLLGDIVCQEDGHIGNILNQFRDIEKKLPCLLENGVIDSEEFLSINNMTKALFVRFTRFKQVLRVYQKMNLERDSGAIDFEYPDIH